MKMKARRWLLWMGLLSMILGLTACGRLAAHVASRSQNAAPSVAATPSADGLTPLLVNGVTRYYRLHQPATYQADQPMPLVINLHGYHSNAAQQERVSQMSVKADAAGFLVVYPQGLGNPASWKFGSRAEGQADVAFIRALIDQLEAQVSVDRKRVYVTGISNGAEMSSRLACELGDTIAAFATVAGGYPPLADCAPTRPLPVVVFHGTADTLLPYAGHPPLLLPVRTWVTEWAAQNSCDATPTTIFQQDEVTGEQWGTCQAGADVVLYTITGKGHSWPGSTMPARITTQTINATDIIWDFFAAHSLP